MHTLRSLLPDWWGESRRREGLALRAPVSSPEKRERMQALLLSDDVERSGPIREVLLQAGYLCQFPEIMPLDVGLQRATSLRPGLVVVALSPNVTKGIAAIAELRKTIRGRIVAVGPTHDPRVILDSLQQGAEHYLDESQPDGELKRLLERLASLGAIHETEPGKVFCLVTPSGGTGSSTLAVNLAALLAKQARSCGLLDLELETDDLGGLLDLKPANTWADLVRHAEKLDQVGFERALTRHESGVSLLASPRQPEERALVTGDVVRLAFAWARALFPFVVVDLGLLIDEGKIEALRMADTILVVFHLDFTALRNAKRLLGQLEHLGLPRSRVKLVANRHGQPNELPISEAVDCLGAPIHAFVADDPKIINRANNTGKPAALNAPWSKVGRDLTALAKGLVQLKPA